MKIGCITSDGKSVEQVDLSVVKETVYELEIVVVNHPRHYPKYKVSSQTIAFADTQKGSRRTYTGCFGIEEMED